MTRLGPLQPPDGSSQDGCENFLTVIDNLLNIAHSEVSTKERISALKEKLIAIAEIIVEKIKYC